MALPPNYLKAIVKLAVKKHAQTKKFKKMKAVKFGWIKGQAKPWSKDYPGVLNIKRGLLKKGKPKLRIV